MINAIIALLLGSKAGRWVAGGLLFTAVVGIVLYRTYAKGKQDEKLNQKLRQLENVRERIKVDEEIRQMSPSARREQLRKWVRN